MLGSLPEVLTSSPHTGVAWWAWQAPKSGIVRAALAGDSLTDEPPAGKHAGAPHLKVEVRSSTTSSPIAQGARHPPGARRASFSSRAAQFGAWLPPIQRRDLRPGPRLGGPSLQAGLERGEASPEKVYSTRRRRPGSRHPAPPQYLPPLLATPLPPANLALNWPMHLG